MKNDDIEGKKPPAHPQRFSKDIEGHVKLCIRGNLQDISTQFLGNHEIPIPIS